MTYEHSNHYDGDLNYGLNSHKTPYLMTPLETMSVFAQLKCIVANISANLGVRMLMLLSTGPLYDIYIIAKGLGHQTNTLKMCHVRVTTWCDDTMRENDFVTLRQPITYVLLLFLLCFIMFFSYCCQ